MKDYTGYGSDRHANQRDKKSLRRKTEKLMRGNRSVFEIEKSIRKRGHQARQSQEKRND